MSTPSLALPHRPIPSAARAVPGPGDLSRGRLHSIDLLRGVVMVLMALDHARYYFSGAHVSPEDMAQTDLPLFATRWVTHLCAPAFFALTGLSIHLSRQRGNGAQRMAFTRGLWLIVLELTLVGFAWSFNPGHSIFGVIASIGVGMIFVAGLMCFRPVLALSVGAVIIAGHNLLDGLDASAFGLAGFVWRFLHVPGDATLPGGIPYFVLFPIIPWAGIAALGYGLGPYFERAGRERSGFFIAGGVMLAAFALLRVTNLYGNPSEPSIPGAMGDFVVPDGASFTYALIGFLNVEKYPASLQFVLMTLGVCALLLGYLRRHDLGQAMGPVARTIHVFGLVPLAFYVLHLVVIHLLALAMGIALGEPTSWLEWGGTFPASGPADYGYGLPAVYLAWLAALAILYWPCRAIAELKARSRAPWTRYV